MPGELLFAIYALRPRGGLFVDDAEALAAMRAAFAKFDLVAEPGGAIALAAAPLRRLAVAGRTVAALLTCANVGTAMNMRVL